MSKKYLHILCTLLVALLAVPIHAGGLRQVARVTVAPSEINNDSNASRYHNEYPWFTRDGRLMLWTRQDNAGNGTQWLWVAYIKNWDQVAATQEGGAMVPLDIGTPMELHSVNKLWENTPPSNDEIKALATCEAGTWPENDPNKSYLKYKFTLYLAIRDPAKTANEMWRVPGVVVKVDKATGAILSNAQAGTHHEVIPATNHPVANPPVQANETEPMLNREGTILFWASNAWGGQGRIAHKLGPMTACTQGTAGKNTPTSYDTLPSNHYQWKDQYTSTPNYTATSRTNYHAVIQRDNGRSALIFEECKGKEHCDLAEPGNRDCDCNNHNNWFSTTGFDAGGSPTRIANLNNRAPANDSTLLAALRPAGTPWRVTHPAVSGPQHPTKKTWLFFFMRDRKIYYTMLKE